MSMRLFTAVAFDGNAKADIFAFEDVLRSRGVTGNFTREENLHLTLKFLGEVPPSSVAAVKAALSAAARATRPFALTAHECGAFSSRGEKTVWLGVEGSGLAALAAEVDAHLYEAGFERERRPFVPHITLIRRADCDIGTLTEAQVPELAFSVSRITLFESRRDAGKLWYKPIYVAEFSGQEE